MILLTVCLFAGCSCIRNARISRDIYTLIQPQHRHRRRLMDPSGIRFNRDTRFRRVLIFFFIICSCQRVHLD